MKRLLLFLLILPCHYSYSQNTNINILLYDFGGNPTASQSLIIQSYEAAGFDVNLTFSNIDTSLNQNNFDVLIVHEGYFYDTSIPQWVGNPLSETKRVLIESFVINGGHVVWSSESVDAVFLNKSNITINNIYGTSLENGPFFNPVLGGSDDLFRIHPSSGPGGLSNQESIAASGSYSTILNVPNCNKIYTINASADINFSECSHTTFALFPSKPKPDEGSIIISSELGVPFAVIATENFNLFNTQFDNAIALLHYHLLVDEDLAFNEWSDDGVNYNSNCPANIEYNYTDSIICLGDSIRITTNTDTLYFKPTYSGVYDLNSYFNDRICTNINTINAQVLSAIAEAPNDTTICFGESYVFSALNNPNGNISWNNGVIDNQDFIPTQDLYYTLTVNNGGCVGTDSVYVSVEPVPQLSLSITNDSICLGDEIIINASSSTPMANIQLENNIVNNQAFRPNSSTTYIARANLSQCSTTDSLTLFVGEYPSLKIMDDFSTCKDNYILLNAESTNGANISWSNNVQNGLSFLPEQSTLYNVSAELFNCITQDSIMVVVFPNVSADFDFLLEGYSENEFNGIFTNNSTQGDSIEYLWIFVNELNTSTDFETNYIFNANREFVDVSLLVSNQFGCNDSITKSIRLNPDLLNVFYLPTAFTPNDDQINDTFKPIFNIAPIEYEFTIFNRWGEQIFKTNDYNDGWDGIYMGNLAPYGVYVIKLFINKKPFTQEFTVIGEE